MKPHKMQLKLENISVHFVGLTEPVLSIPHLVIASGEQVAITGASGSGKSTFINCITGLERAQNGKISWNNCDFSTMREAQIDRWRGENIGLIMQDFHMFAGLSALDNILLPLKLSGKVTAVARLRAHELLERTGLKRPDQHIDLMSRGEMQRVAIARALLRKPAIIIADEPTASLDKSSGAEVATLILELATQEHCTTIIVSHDERLTSRLQRRIELTSGRVTDDNSRESALS